MMNRTAGEVPTAFDDRVSVVIPLFNHEAYINDAIDGLKSQTQKPQEILVLDDGSLDNSLIAVLRRSREFTCLRVDRQVNAGAATTINRLIGMTTGAFVSILNSDDAYEPARLEQCLRSVENESRPVFVFTQTSFVDNQGNQLESAWYDSTMEFMMRCRDFPLALVNGNLVVSTSNFFLSRSALEVVGPFTDYRYAHDLDFTLRACARGVRIVMLREKLLKYRYHASNTISEDHSKVRDEVALIAAHYVWENELQPGSVRLHRLLEILAMHGMLDDVVLHLHRWGQGGAEARQRLGILEMELLRLTGLAVMS